MKQNPMLNLTLAAALGGAAIAGCTQKPPASAADGERTGLGPQYSAKKGLLLPEETRRSLGVRVVEVNEQQVRTTFDFTLRVYQCNGRGGMASGSLPPEEAKRLKAGQPVQMKTIDGMTCTATVSGLNHELEQATGTTEVLVEFSSAPGAVRIGTFLEASAALADTSAVSVPRTALLQCSDGYAVYAVNGEHFVRTAVQVGARSSDFVEIKDGLYAGDQVVLQPVMALWMTELAAVKGGQACCATPAKGK
jgi:hypothetical protein